LSDLACISAEDVERLVRKKAPEKEKNSSINFHEFETYHDFKEFTEAEFIESKLEQFDWNISHTAEKLGLQRSHLYQKIKKFGLER